MTIQSKNWHAWLNTMPPKPDHFHVVGDVIVANPGVHPILAIREPQGINQNILILDFHLVQQPGVWPQVVTCIQARFDRVIVGSTKYTSVEIYSGESKIVAIDQIEIVS